MERNWGVSDGTVKCKLVGAEWCESTKQSQKRPEESTVKRVTGVATVHSRPTGGTANKTQRYPSPFLGVVSVLLLNAQLAVSHKNRQKRPEIAANDTQTLHY